MDKTRIIAAFLNPGHALGHPTMPIHPTVIPAMNTEFGRDCRSMLPLACGTLATAWLFPRKASAAQATRAAAE